MTCCPAHAARSIELRDDAAPLLDGLARLPAIRRAVYTVRLTADGAIVSRGRACIGTIQGINPLAVIRCGLHLAIDDTLNPDDTPEHRAQAFAVAAEWLRHCPPLDQPVTELGTLELQAWAVYGMRSAA